MRVLFINPAMERYTRQFAFPLGLLSIATYLKAKGHQVKILDRTLVTTNIEKELSVYRPDIVGVSVYSMKSFTDSEKVSLAAKKAGIKVVWGGPFVSLAADFVFNNIDIDFISVGEGEQSWLELCNAYDTGIDPKTVPGFAWRENGITKYSAQREFIDLAILPPLDFSLVDVDRYLGDMYGCKKCALLYMSKGCIGQCTFCFNKAFHRQTCRMRPVETFLAEVKYLVENHGVDCIYFADELWCRNRNEMLMQCSAFKNSGIKFKWGVQTRVGIFSGDDFKIMKDAGCIWVDFGIETGSPSMMKTIKKGIPYDKIEQTFIDCEKAGLITLANFIIAFPDETEEQVRETVELAKRIRATQRTFFFFMPGPGSELYDKIVKEGRYIPPKDFEGYTKIKTFFTPKPNLSKVPSRDLKVIRAYFLWKGFSRKHFSDEARTFDIAKKDIMDVLKQFKGHDLKFAFQLFFTSAYEFTDIFAYAHFFPGIRKKYNLYISNK